MTAAGSCPDQCPPICHPAVCVCGTALRLCPGCDDARCYSCNAYGTSNCDDFYGPPDLEEVPA